MKIIKTFLIVGLMFAFLSGCQSIKDNLSMKKKNNTNEFLVKKKNPLVMPPDFEKLPKPLSEQKLEDNSDNEELDLSKILKSKTKKENKIKNSNLEKSVSDILN